MKKILVFMLILSLFLGSNVHAMKPTVKGFLAGVGPSLILGLAGEKGSNDWLSNYFKGAGLVACALATGVITAILIDGDSEHKKEILGGGAGGYTIGTVFFMYRW